MTKIQMYPLHTRRKLFGIFVLFTVLQSAQCDIKFSTNQLALQLDEHTQISLQTPK